MDGEPELVPLLTDGLTLRGVRAGPDDGPLAILLHGFPEFWFGWRHQIGPLVDAGFRVVVPDQRGYHRSDKPEGVASYALDKLADDVLGLIDAHGRERAALVGHDWGGIVAWWVALTRPERLDRVAILNAPHPAVMRRHLRRNPRQMLRSWYVLLFQVPRLPEAMLGRDRGKPLANSLRKTSRPGTFSDEEIERYRSTWAGPGALTPMIHWYRALARHRPEPPGDVRVRVPTLLIWGTRDRFLGRELARPSIDLCDRGRLELIQEATHWVQHEEPGRVNRLLIEFLSSG